MSDYRQVGFVTKTHGLKGEVRLSFEEVFEDAVVEAKVLFIQVGSRHMPYFVEYFRGDDGSILKLEGMDTPEQARQLVQKPVCLRAADLPEPTLDTAGSRDFVGFAIEDLALGPIGTIDDVFEMPQQLMADLIYQNRRVLIPLNTYFIKRLDPKKRVIVMDLPEGLLTL
jgi:16S rRNA processing protein RimM